MSVGVIGGVLSALNRYDLQNYVSLAQSAVRVTGVVLVLRSGHGIVAIAACELIAGVAANCLLVWIARRLYPELRIELKKPERETLRRLWSYSTYAFLNTIAVQLVYQTDNLVVGAFVSTAAVTFYAIANNLCRLANQAVGAMGSTFVPAASTYEAAGDTHSLLMLYKNGTRATLIVALPILITFVVRGQSFIGLWMGPQYAHSSGTVLAILSVAMFFMFANRAAGSIAFGVGKHKAGALWGIGEGVANLVLSIVLVHWYGIYGVALGTMIPSLFVHLVLWPRYTSELVGLSRFEVLGKVWAPMFLAAVPFAIATYAVDVWLPPHHLVEFMIQVAATLPVFLLTVALVFRAYVRVQLLPRMRSMFLAEAK
jgi:O-antigen/teichoic acid export membrane protein